MANGSNQLPVAFKRCALYYINIYLITSKAWFLIDIRQCHTYLFATSNFFFVFFTIMSPTVQWPDVVETLPLLFFWSFRLRGERWYLMSKWMVRSTLPTSVKAVRLKNGTLTSLVNSNDKWLIDNVNEDYNKSLFKEQNIFWFFYWLVFC